jgi:hypothetical protein
MHLLLMLPFNYSKGIRAYIRVSMFNKNNERGNDKRERIMKLSFTFMLGTSVYGT